MVKYKVVCEECDKLIFPHDASEIENGPDVREYRGLCEEHRHSSYLDTKVLKVIEKYEIVDIHTLAEELDMGLTGTNTVLKRLNDEGKIAIGKGKPERYNITVYTLMENKGKYNGKIDEKYGRILF